jgi:glycopeptide antibiotics resistance protein
MGHRNWSHLLLIASVCGIVVVTLSPFQFALPADSSLRAILSDFHHVSDIKDYWLNIVLFIPFGFGLTWLISRHRLSRALLLIITLVFSIGLSCAVELTQSFLPARISNLTDIVTNTLGGVVGSVLYLWWPPIFSFTAAILQINGKKLTASSLLVAFTSYFSLITTAILVLLISNNLSNWNDNFSLSIGNEATGNRPWQGSVRSIYMSDQALPNNSIAQAFSDNNTFFSKLPNLVVSVAFDTQNQLQENFDFQVPPLQWQGLSATTAAQRSPRGLPEKADITNNEKPPGSLGVFVSGERWLKSKGAISIINQRLRKSNEFSLSAIIATDLLQKNGLARIFSISANPLYRNLTLGQNGHDLSLRLRTPITGENAGEPEFIIPNVFQDLNWHQILITFANSNLNFYIDKPQNKSTFTFEPAVTFPTYSPMGFRNRLINLQDFNLLKYQIIFYTLVLVPLGFLGGLLLLRLKIEQHLTGWWIVVICLVPPLLIEQLSMTIGNRPVRVDNLFISSFVLSGATLITMICCWRQLSKSITPG